VIWGFGAEKYMNELLVGLILSGGLILGWLVARKAGFLAPASVYIWFMNMDLALFLCIHFAHLDRSNFAFTAMPWPPFDSVLQPTAMIYGVLIFSGWLSALKLRKRMIPAQSSPRMMAALSRFAGKGSFSTLPIFLFIVLWMEVFHLWDIDKSLLWQNQTYLTIVNPDSAGIDTLLGRLIHFSLRPLGLLLVGAGTFFWAQRRRKTATLFFLLSIYPFLLALAQNSRWAPLYIACVLVVNIFIGTVKRSFHSVIIWGILGLLVFLKVLIGRSTPYQGLAGTVDVFRIIFSNSQPERWILGFFLNVFQGAQNLANAFLLRPGFPEIYKQLSFSPTISAIDHFDEIVNVYQVKIAPVVPMNAYAEAWLFGKPYFLFLTAILVIWLRTMTKLFLRRDAIGTAFSIFSYWIIFYISQYAIRNSMRLIYLSLLIGGWIIYGNRRSHRSLSKHEASE